MPFETRAARAARLQRSSERYPELNGSDLDEVAAINEHSSRTTGSPASQFGRDIENLYARNIPGEMRERGLESFQEGYLSQFRKDEFGRLGESFGGGGASNPFARGAIRPRSLGGSIEVPGSFEFELQRLQSDPSSPFARGGSPARGDLRGLDPGLLLGNEPLPEPERRIGSESDGSVLGDIKSGFSAFNFANPFHDTEGFDPDAGKLIRNLDPNSLQPFTSDPREAYARDRFQPAGALGLVSGTMFLEQMVRGSTNGELGIRDIGINPEEMDPLSGELLEALAPINFVVAFQGAGMSTAIRSAAANRSGATRFALNRIADLVEPFAGKGVPAFGREIAADVGAQEAFRRTEDLPFPVRMATALIVGAGAAYSPEIARSLHGNLARLRPQPEIPARAVALPLANPQIDPVIARNIERFGVTADPNRAGYILPDGQMLDFNRGFPRPDTTDMIDHRTISAPELVSQGPARRFDSSRLSDDVEMLGFMNEAGAIRTMPEVSNFNLGINTPPTAFQIAELRRTVARNRGAATRIEITDINGGQVAYKNVYRQVELDDFLRQQYPAINSAIVDSLRIVGPTLHHQPGEEFITRFFAGLPTDDSRHIPLDDLTDARRAIRSSLDVEIDLNVRRVPQAETRAGRAGQAERMRAARAAVAEQGLRGEEANKFIQAAMASDDTLRQTFAEPLDLPRVQIDAMEDEIRRLTESGDQFDFAIARTAWERLQEGLGLRDFELNNQVVQDAFGIDVMESLRQVHDVPPRLPPTGPIGARVPIPDTDLPAARPSILPQEQSQQLGMRFGFSDEGAPGSVLQPEVTTEAIEEVLRGPQRSRIPATGPEGPRVAVPDTILPASQVQALDDVVLAGLREPRPIGPTDSTPIPGGRGFARIQRSDLPNTVPPTPIPGTAEIGALYENVRIADGQLGKYVTPAGNVADETAPFGKLEADRLAGIEARNKADAVELGSVQRELTKEMIDQRNALSASEAAAARETFDLTLAVEATHPNSITLRNKIREFMNSPITGTPEGEVPRGVSGKVIGEAAAPELPRVPVEQQALVDETLDNWLKGTDARLANLTAEEVNTFRAINAQLTGQLDDPLLTWAVYRRTALTEALQFEGLESQAARAIADDMFDMSLANRLGDPILEIRPARPKAQTAVRNRMRAEQGKQQIDDTTEEFFDAVNQELEDQFVDRYGMRLVAQERHVEDQLRLMDKTGGLQSVSDFVQRAKNTQFGLFDIGVLGVQLPAAVNRGGASLFAKMVNDALASMKLPNARHIYTQTNLPRQVERTLDGVDQGVSAAIYQNDVGSLLELIPKVGKKVDQPGIAVADKLTDFQFGTILGGARNADFEGNLVIFHLASKMGLPGNYDVTDPLVRQTAATYANHVASSAVPALRGNRNLAENILTISARMARARFNHIMLMAKVWDLPLVTAERVIPGAARIGIRGSKNVTAADRLLAATTIVSSMFYTLVTAAAINEAVGLTDFEVDPSKPGFGLITIDGTGGDKRVIDVIAQDSVTRAFARSLRELQDGDPAEAGSQWARVYMGSSSIIGKIPTAIMGYGFDPSRGWVDDLELGQGLLLNMAPMPPIFTGLITEGYDHLGTTLDVGGVTNFPEDAYGKSNRILEGAGFDPQEMESHERRDELQNLGVLTEIDQQTREELEDRNDREASALLVKYDRRDRLTEAYGEALTGEGKSQYRDDRRAIMDEFAVVSETFEDIWRGYGDDDSDAKRLASQRYELRDQAAIGNEVDYDLLERLEAQFDAGITDPVLREDMMAIIESVDPLENPWEKEYRLLQTTLGEGGWWDIDDQAWAEMRDLYPEAANFDSFEKYRKNTRAKLSAEVNELYAPGIAPGELESEWARDDVNQQFRQLRLNLREDWAGQDQRHLELASRAAEWDLWRPSPAIEDAFSRFVSE